MRSDVAFRDMRDRINWEPRWDDGKGHCIERPWSRGHVWSFNNPDPPLTVVVLLGLSLSGFTIYRGRFPHPYKWWFVLLHSQCGTSQSTSFGAQRPCWHSFLPPIDVGSPQIHPLLGPASLLVHCLVSTHLRGTTRRLTHRPMSDSDTICKGVKTFP